MKKKLFQYAVLFHEKKEGTPNTKESYETKTLIEPKTLLAQDEQSALLKIARELPEEYMDRVQDIEIIIRPF